MTSASPCAASRSTRARREPARSPASRARAEWCGGRPTESLRGARFELANPAFVVLHDVGEHEQVARHAADRMLERSPNRIPLRSSNPKANAKRSDHSGARSWSSEVARGADT